MADFLLSNKAEVVAMSIFEYDEESELKKIRKDEYELGMESGMECGREMGIRALIESLQELGLSEEETCFRVMQKFSLSSENAEDFLKKYWK